jgi:transcriptional regulator with XRE-family HTH domain
MTTETLGSRIKRFRQLAGLKQRDLGEACGWPFPKGQTRISNYERNFSEPSLKDLEAIAQALNCTVNDLIAGESGGANHGDAHQDLLEAVRIEPFRPAEGDSPFTIPRSWLDSMGLKLHQLRASHKGLSPDTFPQPCISLLDTGNKLPQHNAVFALTLADGRLVFRRFLQQSISNSWIIRSESPDRMANPDEVVRAEDIPHLTIEGRVIWAGSRL